MDGGVNWTTIETSVPVNYNTNYTWPQVPIQKSSSAMVKVYDSSNSNITDNSDTFNIVGDLRVLAPDGAENWIVGSTHWISWTSTQVSSINASYSLNNGTNWTVINPSVPAGDGGLKGDKRIREEE